MAELGSQVWSGAGRGTTCRSRRRFHLEFGKAVAELEDDGSMGFRVFGTVGMQLHMLQNEAKELFGLKCAVGQLTHSRFLA